MADTVLIPGLKVIVDGSSDGQGLFVAETITVDGDDLETSAMIEAGLHPTAEQIAANVGTIEGNKKSNAAHQQNIAANQQAIAGNKERIALPSRQYRQNLNYNQGNT